MFLTDELIVLILLMVFLYFLYQKDNYDNFTNTTTPEQLLTSCPLGKVGQECINLYDSSGLKSFNELGYVCNTFNDKPMISSHGDLSKLHALSYDGIHGIGPCSQSSINFAPTSELLQIPIVVSENPIIIPPLPLTPNVPNPTNVNNTTTNTNNTTSTSIATTSETENNNVWIMFIVFLILVLVLSSSSVCFYFMVK